jgi:hypothetical protein
MTSDDKGPSARIYPPRLHFCLSSTHVIAGYSDQYELKVMDFYGKAVGTIRKKSDPVKLTPGGDFLTRFPLQMHDFRMPLTWKNNSLYLIDMNRDGDYFIK